MLARLVAIETGTGNTFAAIDPAIRQALATYGIASRLTIFASTAASRR